jgi:hypothetical protein
LVLRHNVGHFIAVPGLMARLESYPDAGREGVERQRQPTRIGGEVRRQLQEYRPDFVRQTRSASE